MDSQATLERDRTLIGAIENLPAKLERALTVLSEVENSYFAHYPPTEAEFKVIAMNYTRIASFLEVVSDYICDTKEALDAAINEDYKTFRLARIQANPDLIRDYCTQNGGDCVTCSLVNYGRDCMNNPLP